MRSLIQFPGLVLKHLYLPEIEKIDIGNMQHRRFTDRDIELIKKVKAYRDKGFTVEAAIESADAQKPRF
ncbi:MAG: MerR family transcriptional regulator [Deltaproteobacteria bacterium]|nr:MerR family transcriptional regulator [Deltaproteobacteria bacterium]